MPDIYSTDKYESVRKLIEERCRALCHIKKYVTFTQKPYFIVPSENISSMARFTELGFTFSSFSAYLPYHHLLNSQSKLQSKRPSQRQKFRNASKCSRFRIFVGVSRRSAGVISIIHRFLFHLLLLLVLALVAIFSLFSSETVPNN